MYKATSIMGIINVKDGINMFEIKKPEYVNKTFRLDKSLVDELSRCAADNDISVNALVAQCCSYALKNLNNENIEQIKLGDTK